MATVAANARAARQALVLTVKGGDTQTARLDSFIEEAAKADTLGTWLKSSIDHGIDVGKKIAGEAVGAAVGVSTIPTITALVGVVLAATHVLQGVGRTVGAGVAGLVVVVVALIAKNPGPMGQAVWRLGSATAQQL